MLIRRLWPVGSLLILSACSLLAPTFEKPTLSVVSVQLVGGNFRQQNLLVTFDIKNPNDRTLPVTSLHANLSVAGDPIATGVSTRSFVVPAHGENQFDMTITANMALALLKLAGRTANNGAIEYDLTGGANIDLPFMHDLPFSQHGSFPLNF